MNVTSLTPALSPQSDIQRVENERLDKLQLQEQENSFWGIKAVEWREHSLTVLGVTLFVGSVASFTMAYFGFVVVWIAAPVGVGLFLAGVVAITIFNLIPHYDSTLYLKNVRYELEERYQLLQELLRTSDDSQYFFLKRRASTLLTHVADKEHDWESMFRFGIPLPSRFKEYFLFQVTHMDVQSAADLYLTVVSEYEKARAKFRDNVFTYDIPHPREWIGERWIRETQSMPLAQILQSYNIDVLKSLNIIPEDEANTLLELRTEFRAIKLRFDEETGAYQKVYNRHMTPIRLNYESKVEEIHNKLEFNSAVIKLHDLKQSALREVATLQRKKEEELVEPRKLISQYSLAATSGNYPSYWRRRQEEEEARVADVERRYDLFENDVRDRYNKLQEPLERDLALFKCHHLRALEEVEHELRVKSAPHKYDYERLVTPYKILYERALSLLEESYDRACRLPRYTSL